MERWQHEHILRNLVELIKLTSINPHLIASLKAKKVLSDIEAESIEHQILMPSEKSKKLYEILPHKVGSYEILIETLDETRQTGAARILREHTSKFREYGSIFVDEHHVLGTGASSKVFKGKFENRDVAVKVLHTNLVDVEIIHREVELLRKIDGHENIVRHFVAENHDTCIYIALELCVISLQDEIKIKLLNIDPTSTLFECTKGINHVHKQNIVHRDLKPANILLTKNKQVKIADFGLSKQIPIGMSGITIHTGCFGTADWMAPEVLKYMQHGMANNETLKMNKSTDMFSLGCIFYFTLTDGLHPFGDNLEKVYNISHDKSQISEELIPKVWFELIKNMISSSVTIRPTASDVLNFECFASANILPTQSYTKKGNAEAPNCTSNQETTESRDDYLIQVPATSSKPSSNFWKQIKGKPNERSGFWRWLSFSKKSLPNGNKESKKLEKIDYASLTDKVKRSINTCKELLENEELIGRGASSLHVAVMVQERKTLEYFISLGDNINARDKDGDTPLHWCCHSEDNMSESFPILIQYGADINAVNNEGNSILHSAADWSKSTVILEQIVKAGIDTTLRNNRGHTILHSAVAAGNVDAVKYFCSLGADLNSADLEEKTPLFLAVGANKNLSEIVRILAKSGANMNALNWSGTNILFGATVLGRTKESLQAMVEAGANKNFKNTKGQTVLHAAVGVGNLEAIEYFSSIGVNPNTRDYCGRTPLLYLQTAKQNLPEMLNVLVNNRADINAADIDGDCLLHLFTHLDDLGSKQNLELIVRAGADTNFRDKNGDTHLHRAVRAGNVEAVEYFIQIGISIHEKNKFGCTPLFVLAATKQKFAETLGVLLKYGADINTRMHNGITLLPLMISSKCPKEHIDLVKEIGGR